MKPTAFGFISLNTVCYGYSVESVFKMKPILTIILCAIYGIVLSADPSLL